MDALMILYWVPVHSEVVGFYLHLYNIRVLEKLWILY